MVDLNVVLDVMQHREPHYTDSARVLDAVVQHVIEGVIPSHCVTTLSYILSKHVSTEKTHDILRWLLDHFSIEPATHLIFQTALALQFADYEDAVVHALAESARCDCIITRNTQDFSQATLPVFSPTEFLDELESQM